MLDYIVKPFALVAYQMTKRKEKQLGYGLKLNNLPAGWMDCTTIFDITHVWKRAGMEATGISYFTIGAVENSLSSRYDSNSPYYQAWVGGYLVKFVHPREWSISDHFNLASSDQKDWLAQFGDPSPLSIPDFTNIQEKGEIKVGGFSGSLYQGGIWSHTDIGSAKKSIIFYLLMAGFAYFAKQSNPHLKLTSKNLIPQWEDNSQLNSFQKVRLEGYTAIINISENIQAVLFGNGAQFIDKSGKKHDTFLKIGPEILRIIKSIEIIKI